LSQEKKAAGEAPTALAHKRVAGRKKAAKPTTSTFASTAAFFALTKKA
jgi:hypothetical protein